MGERSDWATGCNSRADEAQRRGKRKSLSALSENQDEGEANGPSGTCPIPAPAFRTWPMLSRLHGLCSWGRGKLWPEPSLTSLQERERDGREKEEERSGYQARAAAAMIRSEAGRGLSVSMPALEGLVPGATASRARRRTLRAVIVASARRPMPFAFRGEAQLNAACPARRRKR